MGAPGTRILLVEDEKPLRSSLARLLGARLGAEVTAVADSRAALAAATEAPFNAAVVDVHLRGELIHESLPKLRKLLRDAPIVAFSGRATPAQAFELYPLGVQHYVEKGKPDSLCELVETLEHLLEGGQCLVLQHGSHLETVGDVRRRMIEDAMEKTNGNKKAAARELGISARRLRYWLKKYET